MHNYTYMWSNDEFNYDEDIYKDEVYEDWEIKENQRLLMLESSQLQEESPIFDQNVEVYFERQ